MANSRRKSTRILVAEDNSDQLDLYADYLTFRGFDVDTASDGVAAFHRAAETLPDLIVMDLSMPRLDGWEATRRLKAYKRTAHIPVIACTAHAFGFAVERAIDAGCDAYVVKPCLPEDLLREIRRVLRRSAASRRRA